MTTLAEIKTRQDELAQMIAAFEAQPVYRRIRHFPETSIELAEGEHYAGLIVGKEGEESYHLILLPGEAESVNFEQAKEWAEKSGGALPSRREQALLYANLKGQFKAAWYWSGELHASDSVYAWSQVFGYGGKDYDRMKTEDRIIAAESLEDACSKAEEITYLPNPRVSGVRLATPEDLGCVTA